MSEFYPKEWLLERLGLWRAGLRRDRSPRRQSGGINVYCFGQSHSVCLRRALARSLYRPVDKAFHVEMICSEHKVFPRDGMVVTLPSGEEAIHPQLDRLLRDRGIAEQAADVWLASAVLGGDYCVFGLFESDPPFDFIHPDLPFLPVRPGAQLVPYDAVMSLFKPTAVALRQMFRSLPRRNVKGVLHLEGPPPIPDAKQCLESLEHDILRRELKVTDDVTITPREFRMKLWRCQSDVSRQVCQQENVMYVSPPEEALDAEGYLLPEAWHGATHTTAWYGAHALRKIERLIVAASRPPVVAG